MKIQTAINAQLYCALCNNPKQPDETKGYMVAKEIPVTSQPMVMLECALCGWQGGVLILDTKIPYQLVGD